MDKLKMLCNLLSEYIVGSPFEMISPQIFKVLTEFCSEVSASVLRDSVAIVKTIPTLSEQYQSLLRLKLGFPATAKELEAVKKRQNISKFANNDISINHDLKLSSRMFSDAQISRDAKPIIDFEEIK